MAEAWNVNWLKDVFDTYLSPKTSAIKMVLLKDTYTYSATHDNLSDVLATHRSSIATLQGIGTSIVNTDDLRLTATAPAADPDFAADAGVSVTKAWVYYDSGVESTSQLLRYFDFASQSVNDGANITLPTSQLGEIRNPA